MEKIKDFLSKPAGMITLVALGFGLGWFLAKRKKTGYRGR